MSLENNSAILFFDLETTGRDYNRHGVHQIGGLLDIGGKTVSVFNKKVRPYAWCTIEPGALRVSNTKEEDMWKYPRPEVIFQELVSMLSVALGGGASKIYLCGYAIGTLDIPFLKQWFEDNGRADLFKNYFHSAHLDVMSFAAKRLMDEHIEPASYEMANIARLLGLQVEHEKRHTAIYDAELCRNMYYQIFK